RHWREDRSAVGRPRNAGGVVGGWAFPPAVEDHGPAARAQRPEADLGADRARGDRRRRGARAGLAAGAGRRLRPPRARHPTAGGAPPGGPGERGEGAGAGAGRGGRAGLGGPPPRGSVFVARAGPRPTLPTPPSDPPGGLVFYAPKACLPSVAESDRPASNA